MAAAWLDELRQERQKEDRGFGVEQVDDEAVAQQPRMVAVPDNARNLGGFAPAEDLPDPEPDQVGGTDILDGAESQGGGGQDRGQAQGGGRDMDQRRRMNAGHRHQTGTAALLDRAPDDVE